MKIESFVSSGKFVGEKQVAWKNVRNEYALSACPSDTTENGHHNAHYILVGDLQSVANGLRAGLRLRMVSPNVSPSLRKAEEITLDGKPVSTYDPPKRA